MHDMRTLAAALALCAAAVIGCVEVPVAARPPHHPEGIPPRQDAPYIGTPQVVVDAMLALAEVGPADLVYDLGSGDGRIVIAAARDRGARGVGVEIDPELVSQSRQSAEGAGVADRVRFVEQDLFLTDLRAATVVTLYLSPTLNLRLRPTLLRELAPGSRIVAHDFDMGDWPPTATRTVRSRYRDHRVFLWVVPARAP